MGAVVHLWTRSKPELFSHSGTSRCIIASVPCPCPMLTLAVIVDCSVLTSGFGGTTIRHSLPIALGHAHNDEKHEVPLFGALNEGAQLACRTARCPQTMQSYGNLSNFTSLLAWNEDVISGLAGFCSIEADVYVVNGALVIGHDVEDLNTSVTLQVSIAPFPP